MSPLPRAVQRQADEVTRIEKELADRKAVPTSETSETTPPPETPSPEVPPAPTPPPQPTPDVVAEWEQRYRTLKGKYEAEVPRLHQQVRDLTQSVQELTQRSQQPPTPAPETPPQKKRLVTDKDAETFGPDLLDLIKRQSEEIAEDLVSKRSSSLQNEIKRLETENQTLKAQLGDVSRNQETSAQENYLAKLTNVVPDWEQVNTDQRFLLWLGEVDPFTGLQRQAYLDDAFKALDVNRTAHLFNAWKQSVTPAAPAPVQQRQTTELQRQVTPGKSKATPAPAADPNTRIWTVNEIEQFYVEVRKGQHTPDEARRIENEINLAVSTGRVK